MNVYRCPHCKWWHLGRSRNPARQANWIGHLLDKHSKKLAKRMGLDKGKETE